MRLDDAARDEVAEEFGRHFADGRPDLDEYEERLEQALAARLDIDLVPVTSDLPRLVTTEESEQPRVTVKRMLAGWLSLAARFRRQVGTGESWRSLLADLVDLGDRSRHTPDCRRRVERNEPTRTLIRNAAIG